MFKFNPEQEYFKGDAKGMTGKKFPVMIFDSDQIKIGPFGVLYSEVTSNYSLLKTTHRSSNLLDYPSDTYDTQYLLIPINFNHLILTDLDFYPHISLHVSQIRFKPSFIRQFIRFLFLLCFFNFVFSL